MAKMKYKGWRKTPDVGFTPRRKSIPCGKESLIWLDVYHEYGNRSLWHLSVRYFEKAPKTWVRGFRAKRILRSEYKTEQEAIDAGEAWIQDNRERYSMTLLDC
jgi:hypothetical protein